MNKRIFSERVELISKSREAALSAVQLFNNPNTTFKTESFIVLFIIAWTYLLHAYYRKIKVEYRYHELINGRKYFEKIDGDYKFWDLSKCISGPKCPLDKNTINNLQFMIGLRNQIEHRKSEGIDGYFSARYQACALNFNFYLKKLHGDRYSLDRKLALSLQFAEFDYDQSQIMKDAIKMIPTHIRTYVADFENQLTENEIEDERFAYRLLFSKVVAKRTGQADRLIEFLLPSDPLAKNIKKEYWIKEDREKPKYIPSQIVAKMREAGYKKFGMHQHTKLWQEHDAKNPAKGYGARVAKAWYWYQNWLDFVRSELSKLVN